FLGGASLGSPSLSSSPSPFSVGSAGSVGSVVTSGSTADPEVGGSGSFALAGAGAKQRAVRTVIDAKAASRMARSVGRVSVGYPPTKLVHRIARAASQTFDEIGSGSLGGYRRGHHHARHELASPSLRPDPRRAGHVRVLARAGARLDTRRVRTRQQQDLCGG